MASAARAVRIRREEAETPSSGQAAPSPGTGTALSPPGRRFANVAGSNRALRTFLLFLVCLAVIYAVFINLAVRSSSSTGSLSVEAILTGAVGVSLVVGWWVTLGQAPTVAWTEGSYLVVRDRFGRSRRFARDRLQIHVLRTNGTGFLGRDPTEFVELGVPGGRSRTYLVGTHFFDFAH